MRVASFVALALIAAACGGAAETNLFDEVPNSASSGGASSSGAASSSGLPSSSGAASSASSSGGPSSSSASSSSSGGCANCQASSGTVPIDAGPDIRVCNVNHLNVCPSNEYCRTEGCAVTGVCAPRPTPTLDLTPVCGCDHVTYWNATIAAAHGANVAGAGQCGATATACTRNSGCVGDASCNLAQPLVCSLTEVKGTCWQLPKSCDGTNAGLVRRCNGTQCISLCTAIADERQFLPGTGCQ